MSMSNRSKLLDGVDGRASARLYPPRSPPSEQSRVGRRPACHLRAKCPFRPALLVMCWTRFHVTCNSANKHRRYARLPRYIYGIVYAVLGHFGDSGGEVADQQRAPEHPEEFAVRNRPTCWRRRRRNSRPRSTSRQQRHTASRSRLGCSPPPTRRSNEPFAIDASINHCRCHFPLGVGAVRKPSASQWGATR